MAFLIFKQSQHSSPFHSNTPFALPQFGRLRTLDNPIDPLTSITSTVNMSRRQSFVDLTSTTTSSERLPSLSVLDEYYGILSAGTRGVKRRREDDGFWSPGSSQSDGQNDEPIESIDLTEQEDSLAKTLAKQREDAIKAQQSTEGTRGRSLLNAYKCPVCMDTPEDATSTSCGKLKLQFPLLSFFVNSLILCSRPSFLSSMHYGLSELCRGPAVRPQQALQRHLSHLSKSYHAGR